MRNGELCRVLNIRMIWCEAHSGCSVGNCLQGEKVEELNIGHCNTWARQGGGLEGWWEWRRGNWADSECISKVGTPEFPDRLDTSMREGKESKMISRFLN